ncbi:MAG: hypothetical protein ACJAXK_000179 [Yoonia sp.]|jgi:hypothetical protein
MRTSRDTKKAAPEMERPFLLGEMEIRHIQYVGDIAELCQVL